MSKRQRNGKWQNKKESSQLRRYNILLIKGLERIEGMEERKLSKK